MNIIWHTGWHACQQARMRSADAAVAHQFSSICYNSIRLHLHLYNMLLRLYKCSSCRKPCRQMLRICLGRTPPPPGKNPSLHNTPVVVALALVAARTTPPGGDPITTRKSPLCASIIKLFHPPHKSCKYGRYQHQLPHLQCSPNTIAYWEYPMKTSEALLSLDIRIHSTD